VGKNEESIGMGKYFQQLRKVLNEPSGDKQEAVDRTGR